MHSHAGDTVQLATIIPAGDDLCLDYANTLYWRGRDTPVESLTDIGALLGWLNRSAHLPPPLLDAAQKRLQADLSLADALFSHAIATRETIYRVFATVATGETVTGADLDALNAALAWAPIRSRLLASDGLYGWAASGDFLAPVLLAPVLWSAADLLTHLANRRVRRCANDQCLWLFIDHSKGGTRRWCDMAACGNRAKSQRHYLRSKPTPRDMA